MPKTPIYEWPFPDDEDAPDGPAQMGAMAEAGDATKWLSRSLKPTTGLVSASADKSEIGESYEDLGGTETKLTLPVKSFVLVTAVWQVQSTQIVSALTATMRFNSTDHAATAISFHGDATSGSLSDNITQIYREELAAGEHTLKMRVKASIAGLTTLKVLKAGTRYSYSVHAA